MIREIKIDVNNHPFKLEEVLYGNEFVQLSERVLLCHLAAECTGNILEIGCNKGITTRMLALNNPYKIIYGVDYVEENTGDLQQAAEKPPEIAMYARDLKNVVLLDLDSRKLNYDLLFQNVELIFLDGNHTYDFVKIDSEKALSYMKKRGSGTIIWHDYWKPQPWIGVMDYVDQFIAPNYEMIKIGGMVACRFKF